MWGNLKSFEGFGTEDGAGNEKFLCRLDMEWYGLKVWKL